MSQIARMSEAKKSLARARSIEEVRQVRDTAEAVRVWAKAAAERFAIQNEAAELKLMAERKAGGMLAELSSGHGGDRRSSNAVLLDLEEKDIGKMQSSRWQKLATISEDRFLAYVQACNDRGDEITQSGLLKIAQAPHSGEGVPSDKSGAIPQEK